MRKLIFSISAFLLVMSSIAQDYPYQLKKGKDVALLGAGLVTFGIGARAYLATNVKLIYSAPPSDPGRVNAFDRSATRQFSVGAADASDVGVGLLGLTPVGIGIGASGKFKNVVTTGVMYTEACLFTVGATMITKGFINRLRPLAYNPNVAWDTRTDYDVRNSFFSGHTSLAFTSAMFGAKVLHDLFPDMKHRWLPWTVAGILAGTVGYLRYRAGKHFPTDILTGAAVGTVVGITIPQIHKRKE